MKNPSTRRLLLQALAAATLAGAASGSLAQGNEWPKGQPIRFVVPFTAGSGTDVLARTVGEKLGGLLGTQVVVENRPGAGGTLGAGQVAKSAADGYTFLVHSSGHVANPALYPRLPYDTQKDLEGVLPLASLPNVLVVAGNAGIQDVADLVARVKAKPDEMFYASAGNGSATHMNAEKFRVAAGLKAQHVPFRGTPEAITETVAGRTHWFFAPLVSALPLITEGRLKALAVGTTERSPVLPAVPSLAEAGLPDAAYTFWVGLFAPAGTPAPVLNRMHEAVTQVMAMPDVKERLAKLGASPMPMSRADFATYLRQETEAAAALVRSAGIRIE